MPKESLVKVIRENSWQRILWDLLILMLILTSNVLIPFQIGFQHVESRSGTTVLYLIDLFFFIDIFLNFITSYRHDGMEITDRRSIARHYLRTMFPVDILANFPFDAIVLAFGATEFHNISFVLLLRMLQLIRIVRLIFIIRRWENESWMNSGYLRIGKFLLVIITFVHWVACSWFFVAFIDHFPSDSWATYAGIETLDIATQYIRSLYWAISTMATVGYGDITPHRNIEYIFTILVMMLGVYMYAFIIGNIASLFSNLDAAKAHFRNRVDAVNHYFRARRVPNHLNEQVRNYYEYIWARHRGVRHELLLDDLPAPLRLDILLYLTRDLLAKVPLFLYASPALRNVLLMALKAQTYAPDVFIARNGEVGKEIFFISHGKMEIRKDNEKCGFMEDGDYFGDLSLILSEIRTASVRTLTYCEVFVLTNTEFKRIKEEYSEFHDILKRIATEQQEKRSELLLKGIIL
jgi:hypothetical protein